ncbi:hypothetical protein PFISCL1PPCAC_17394, partial [Pristionchus fissidentatus]
NIRHDVICRLRQHPTQISRRRLCLTASQAHPSRTRRARHAGQRAHHGGEHATVRHEADEDAARGLLQPDLWRLRRYSQEIRDSGHPFSGAALRPRVLRGPPYRQARGWSRYRMLHQQMQLLASQEILLHELSGSAHFVTHSDLPRPAPTVPPPPPDQYRHHYSTPIQSFRCATVHPEI